MQGKESTYELIYNIFNNLENANIIDILNSKDSAFKNKEDIYNILDYINNIFFDRIKGNETKYIKCIEIIENTKDRLKKNSNFDMAIDRMLIKICEELN